MNTHRLEPLQILDWYDGVVLALARASWRSGVLLLSLLAWTQTEGERIFALVPVTEAQAETIKSMKDWETLKQYLQAIAAEASGDILLVRLNEDQDEIVREVSVGVRDVQMDLFGDVESALGSERRRWFDLV